MALVAIENLSYSYAGEGEKRALDSCTLQVERGESVLLVGPSGCGKSTLLRAVTGLVPHFYGGWMSGSVLLGGREVRDSRPADHAHVVGCVFQDPEAQIVTSTVHNEVVFALENVGSDPAHMELRAHEVLSALGMGNLGDRSTRELSGGQLQRVALAAALAPQPSLVLLDEPTSQLDPAAAETLFSLLRRINEEAGITVLLAEHRLERCYHWADRVVIMDEGRIVCNAPPREAAQWAIETGSPFAPPVPRIFAGRAAVELPLTVREGAAAVRALLEAGTFAPRAVDDAQHAAGVGAAATSTAAVCAGVLASATTRGAVPLAIDLRGLTHVYPSGVEAISDCGLSVRAGESISVMGENGAGKSTLVRHVNGLLRSPRGSVRLFGDDIARTPTEALAGTVAFLGQNPNDYLFSATVADELRFTLHNVRPELASDAAEQVVAETLALLGIERYAAHAPRSLSAGERQRVALASVLCAGANIVVLDEPTRGMDRLNKEALGATLRTLQAAGKTVVVVTHDVEFAAEFTDRTVVLGLGRIIADGPVAEVLSATIFLSPQANRVMRDVAPDVMTVAQARALLSAGEAL